MREMIVDLFAGGGGASFGIEQALGVPVDLAVNHDEEAIRMHWLNHPHTRHRREDVWAVDPVEATAGQPVGLLWASPDCTHFSRAKGGKPVERKTRSLAWVVVRWARAVRPRLICLENVPEFQEWGPLTAEQRPCPKRKGRTWNLWCNQLRALGYSVESRVLKACDYGAPTIRRRLFVIARCDGRPIIWPNPSHGPGLMAYRTAAECIDWSLPCPSIFLTSAQARRCGVRRPLAENTLRRIARGLRKFVIECEEPFLIGIDNKSSSSAEWSLAEPLRTITRENRFALISPHLSKYHGPKGGETRGQDCRDPLATADTSNRFALVAAFLAKYYGGATGSSAESPLGTVTAVDHNALVAAHLTKFYGTGVGAAMDSPVPTITGGGQHIGHVQAFLLKYYGTAVGQPLNTPLHTITAKDRLGLVAVRGEAYRIVDIGLRMLKPKELMLAQGFDADYVLTGTQSAQVARLGNSVPPPIARAIVAANVRLAETKQEAMA